MMNRRMFNVLLGALLGVLAVGGYMAWVGYGPTSQRDSSSLIPAVARGDVGGPFEAVDHTGRPVTQADFEGQLSIYYFGFTFCPDICPTELSVIASAIDLLGEDGDQVQPIFVTIDPERDTPEIMASYVNLFHPRMVGITGSVKQISEMANAFRVFYQKVESDDFSYYLMDHSSFIYVMGADGQNVGIFPYGTSPDHLADSIRAQLDAA